MKNTIVLGILSVFLTSAGCSIIGVLGTPAPSEEKIPPEFDLDQKLNGRILVLVERSDRAASKTNLEYYLTATINSALKGRVKLRSASIVSYNQVNKLRQDSKDFSSLSPVQIGQILGAEKVLLVSVVDYQLYQIAGSGYYEGSLRTISRLYDVATAEVVWPQYSGGKDVKVGFDVESGRGDTAAKRLVAATTQCIVRYLYNCPINQFRVTDEKTGDYF